MYMSYCRFEGTKNELDACMDEVRDHYCEIAEYEVSENEIDHFQRMVRNFVEFLNEYELLNDDNEVDEDKLEEISETMRHSYTFED